MYGIDSGNGYVYGEDLTVESKEAENSKEEKVTTEIQSPTMIETGKNNK